MSKITLLKQCVNLFAKRPNATGVMRTLPSGTRIQILNKGNYIEKTVFKANGNTITSSISKDGSVVSGIKELTKRGEISHSFGAKNYDKVVDVNKNDGTLFTFLGHTDRPNGILYSNVSGRYDADNKYLTEFKSAMDYIRGKTTNSKFIKIIEDLRKEWL